MTAGAPEGRDVTAATGVGGPPAMSGLRLGGRPERPELTERLHPLAGLGRRRRH